MTRTEILKQIQDVFRDVLKQEDLMLNENSSANHIEKWDSLTHIILVVEIEKKFELKFLASEMTGWKNIGEMIDSISQKL